MNKTKNPLLNALNGNPGKRKSTTTKLSKVKSKKTDGFILTVPYNLSRKVEAHCKIVADYLYKHKISQRIDVSAFERYCYNLEFIERAVEDVLKNGIVLYDRHGTPKKHPGIQIQKENGIAAGVFESKYLGEPLSRDLFNSDNGSELSSYLNRKSAGA